MVSNKSRTLMEDFHPRNWLSNFEDTSIGYLFKMGFLYHGLALVTAYAIGAIQEYGFGYEVPLPEFPLGALLLAGPFEETLFFGIPFYLTNNHYVVLAVGLIWASFHAFNTDVTTFSFEYLSYPNLAVAVISLFYSLRVWTSGKGWFSILFHSLYNTIAFIVLGLTVENPWAITVDRGVTEIGMLIISIPLLGITYGLYRWRKRKEQKDNHSNKQAV